MGLILVERKGRLNSRRKRTNRFAPTQALAAFSDAGPVEKNGAGLVVAGSIEWVRRGWIDEWRKEKKSSFQSCMLLCGGGGDKGAKESSGP